MKRTREIFKCNGITFTTYDQVTEYCEKKQYRVTNTRTIFHKGTRVNLVDVTSDPVIPDPAWGMIQANEEAYFDNFCLTNNI